MAAEEVIEVVAAEIIEVVEVEEIDQILPSRKLGTLRLSGPLLPRTFNSIMKNPTAKEEEEDDKIKMHQGMARVILNSKLKMQKMQ